MSIHSHVADPARVAVDRQVMMVTLSQMTEMHPMSMKSVGILGLQEISLDLQLNKTIMKEAITTNLQRVSMQLPVIKAEMKEVSTRVPLARLGPPICLHLGVRPRGNLYRNILAALEDLELVAEPRSIMEVKSLGARTDPHLRAKLQINLKAKAL